MTQPLADMTNDQLILERERRRDLVRALQRVTPDGWLAIYNAAQALGLVRAEMLRRGIEDAYVESMKAEAR